jgi:hypothetical protein
MANGFADVGVAEQEPCPLRKKWAIGSGSLRQQAENGQFTLRVSGQPVELIS